MDPVPDRYAREALIAEGGMGRVFLTHDRRLGRSIAVKEAHDGPAAAAALAREARVIAALEHPGIVAVHDAGTTDDGRPWVAMRLVRGRTLEAVVTDSDSLERRLPLLTHFRDACQAIAYAHSQGVFHRDLKPANVLVGAFGETQVVDWGLAVRASESRPELAGTPAWMAPEQARGEAADARTDVWGLGGVLLFLLTGQSPGIGLDGGVRGGGLVRSLAGHGVPPELAAIAARALAPRREDRYPDAHALAEDVERYLTGARVDAHQYGAMELLARFVRAWRAPLAVAGVAFVLAAVSAVSAARRLAEERDRAVAAESMAERELATSLVAQARQAAIAGAVGRSGILGAEALAWGEHPEARGAVLAARSAWPVVLEATHPVDDCPNAVLLDRGLLCRAGAEVRRVGAEGVAWRAPVAAVSVHPSGTVIAAQRANDVVLLDAVTGAVREIAPRKSPLPLVGTDDGRFASRRWEGESWRGGLSPGERVPLDGCVGPAIPREAALHPTRDLHAAWCADGTVAVTDEVGTVRRIDLDLPVSQHGDVAAIRWAPDGEHLALVWYRGRVGWLDVGRGVLRHATSPSGAGGADVAVASDGGLLAVRRDDGAMELWSTSPLAVVASPPVEGVTDLRWMGPDRLRTLTSTVDATWRLVRGVAPPAVHVGLGVSALTFTPGGDALVSAHSDGLVVTTPLGPGAPDARTKVGQGVVMSALFTPSGDTLVVAPGEELVVRGMDARGGGLEDLAYGMGSRAVLPLGDGRLLALAFEGGAFLHDGSGGWQDAGCGAQEWRSAALSTTEVLLLVGVGGDVAVVRDGRCVGTVPGLLASRVALSPDGTWLIAATAEGLVRATLDGVVAWAVPLSPRDALHLAMSPDGRWVAAGSLDRVARVLDAADGREAAVLRGHVHRVSAVVFSPDSRTLATGSWDGTARLWSLDALDAPPVTLRDHWSTLGWPSASALLSPAHGVAW